jgi:putative transposase
LLGFLRTNIRQIYSKFTPGHPTKTKNHLLTAPIAYFLSQCQKVSKTGAKAYNKKYARKGALWIDYSKRFKITSNHYLTAVINYIHQNPVHHGFVSLPTDWNHSSYFSHVSAKQTLLSRKEVIDWFGGMDAYVKFHKESTAQLMEDWEY